MSTFSARFCVGPRALCESGSGSWGRKERKATVSCSATGGGALIRPQLPTATLTSPRLLLPASSSPPGGRKGKRRCSRTLDGISCLLSFASSLLTSRVCPLSLLSLSPPPLLILPLLLHYSSSLSSLCLLFSPCPYLPSPLLSCLHLTCYPPFHLTPFPQVPLSLS